MTGIGNMSEKRSAVDVSATVVVAERSGVALTPKHRGAGATPQRRGVGERA